MTGRTGLARGHYEAVRELDPGEAMPLFNLARIAEMEGRPAEAARLYAEYARADGGSADPRRRALVEKARSRAAVLGR